MESLERLASSISQAELLVASLKRENRDLAGRLAVLAGERRTEAQTAAARIEALDLEVQAARDAPKRDPALEARMYDAEHRAAGLAQALAEAQDGHLKERGRLETLIRQLEAQVMASHGQELLPTASVENLAEAARRENSALAALSEAQQRGLILEAHVRDLQTRLDGILSSEDRSLREAEALKTRLAEQEGMVGGLQSALAERERLLAQARRELESAAGQQQDLSDLRRQKREAASFARERQSLRRKLEELLATLESVRL